MHRLRDLDRRERWWVAALALLLVSIPLVAAVVNHGRWEPQGDDALIELRARDVGTERTPLVGQPSTSGSYGERAENVAHPGPAGFVVLAPGTRLFGPVTGTLLSMAIVSAAAMLAVPWLVFRQVGRRGGAGAAVLMALAGFSAGAAGLVDPLSSNLGRLPLLAAAVGVWALVCGDLRVAPLTAAFWSFAAQQHLSVLPAAAVLAAVGGGSVIWWVWRRGPDHRLQALAWAGGAVVVGLVMWSPVLWQEVTTSPGNLSALAGYSGDPARQDLGLRSAFDQVANVLGPRPFLGRSSPRGWDLVASRSTVAVLVTFVVLAAVLAAGAWWRRGEPKLAAAAAMVVVLVVAGLVTGANIPDSPEQGRLNFYHWAFALSFFQVLVVSWLLARLVAAATPRLTHGRAVTAAAVAVVVVGAVAVVPVVVDRSSDRLGQPLAPATVRSVLDQLRDSEALAAVEGPVLVLVNGDDRFVQVGDTVGTRLAIEGRDIVFPPGSKGYVHPDRLADVCEIEHALVVSLLRGEVEPPVGVELARADGAPGLDRDALTRLERQAAGVRVDLGPDLTSALEALPGDQGRLIGAVISLRLAERTQEVLFVRSNLELLIDHPPASPQLDRDDLVALRDSLGDGVRALVATEVTAHLLDRDQLDAFRPELTARC